MMRKNLIYKNVNKPINHVINAFSPNIEQIYQSQNPYVLGKPKKRCESAMVLNNNYDKIEIIQNEKSKENIKDLILNKKNHNIFKNEENIHIQQKNNFKKFIDVSDNNIDKVDNNQYQEF